MQIVYNLLTIHYPQINGDLVTEGKSTTTTLLSFVHECQEALDNGSEICPVFFDLCKAFDLVPHQPLLCKLFHLQVNPFILSIIIYLTELSQLC